MKMKTIDIIVAAVFLAALVVIYFFWGCNYDLIVTIIAGVVLIVTGIIAFSQERKLKELQADTVEE